MRTDTENFYQQKINQVIDYISANLHQPLSLKIMADLINVSQRQLLRIMHSSLKESLSAYATRQRLERAVMYMQTEEVKLSEIAGKVGYDNPQSFSKAFKRQFGISPKAYLQKLLLKLDKYVSTDNNENDPLCPEIFEEKEINLIYIRIFGEYGETGLYEMTWNKLIQYLKNQNILSEETRFIGISFDDPNVTQSSQCRFYACATFTGNIPPTEEFGIIRIPKGRYAIFTVKGKFSSLQDTYNKIAANLSYKVRHGIAFEEYQHSIENDFITKIFIPIY